MIVSWKSLALVLSGIVVGCAANAAQTAVASGYGYGDGRRGESYKCYGPSMGAGGIADDLNRLVSEGYEPVFAAQTVVCGRR